MKTKIIDLDPEKRAVKSAWEEFKKTVNACDAEDVKGALFYMDSLQGSVACHLSVFGPDWTLTGRIKTFMTELELESYIMDFEDCAPPPSEDDL